MLGDVNGTAMLSLQTSLKSRSTSPAACPGGTAFAAGDVNSNGKLETADVTWAPPDTPAGLREL